MITLKEIADICGVSVATVSNILNGKPKVSDETKRRVLEVVREMDYQPNFLARNMRMKNTKTIGIITEDLMEFSSTPIVESIMEVCEEWGYMTILINMRMYDKWQDTWYEDREKLQTELLPALHEMQSIRVDGIIYVAGHCRNIDYFPPDFSIPVLVAYGLSSDGRYTSVILDDRCGGYKMTKYLISMGHHKIGVIAGVDNNHHTQERLAGYRRALREASLTFDQNLVCYANWNRESGYLAMEKLLDEDITCVFCMNDFMAAGAYDCLYHHGIEVGREISVAGYDNRNISAFLRPLLTTNDIWLEEVGKKSAKLLLEQINRDESAPFTPRIVKIKSKMVIRDSVCSLG